MLLKAGFHKWNLAFCCLCRLPDLSETNNQIIDV